MGAYAAIGRAARFGLLAFKGLPSFYEVQAPRLAVQDQPPPSKPIIPSMRSDYTTFCSVFQAAIGPQRCTFGSKTVTLLGRLATARLSASPRPDVIG